MKHDHVIVQRPTIPPEQLFLLFHGVGDNPVAMGQIGYWFAEIFPGGAGDKHWWAGSEWTAAGASMV